MKPSLELLGATGSRKGPLNLHPGISQDGWGTEKKVIQNAMLTSQKPGVLNACTRLLGSENFASLAKRFANP